MDCEVRNARNSDVDLIKKIADANREEIGFVLRPIFEASVEQGELLVAVTNSQIVGFLRWHHRRDGWNTIYEICVDEGFRKSGIGAALLDQIPRPIRLKCPTDNKSNNFYRHIGYVLSGQEDGRKRRLNLWTLGTL